MYSIGDLYKQLRFARRLRLRASTPGLTRFQNAIIWFCEKLFHVFYWDAALGNLKRIAVGSSKFLCNSQDEAMFTSSLFARATISNQQSVSRKDARLQRR